MFLAGGLERPIDSLRYTKSRYRPTIKRCRPDRRQVRNSLSHILRGREVGHLAILISWKSLVRIQPPQPLKTQTAILLKSKLAQLIEHLSAKQNVVGLIPTFNFKCVL